MRFQKLVMLMRKTIRRDLKKLVEDFPEKRNSSAIRILASKERLYRESVILFEDGKTIETKIRLLGLQNNLINSLEKTYARFGLIPNEVDHEKQEDQMNVLTQLKLKAWEALEKEKKEESERLEKVKQEFESIEEEPIDEVIEEPIEEIPEDDNKKILPYDPKEHMF
jgi:hypothetical protein